LPLFLDRNQKIRSTERQDALTVCHNEKTHIAQKTETLNMSSSPLEWSDSLAQHRVWGLLSEANRQDLLALTLPPKNVLLS
jgi:hypothetical protein